MQKQNHNLRSYNQDDAQLFSYAALFEGDFSIDWLTDLTQDKPSQILSTLEKGIQEGWLKKKGPGAFGFADKDKQQSFAAFLESKEKANQYRRIVDLLLRELPDTDEKAQVLAPYLLKISNDPKSADWLLKAGDQGLSTFQTEEALQCYSKVLNDLTGVGGKDADRIFTEATITYSKLSMARHDTQKVMAFIQEAIVRAERSNNQYWQTILQMHLAKNEWLRGHHRRAFQLFEKGWARAKEIENPKLLRTAKAFRIFFFWWQGRYQEAVQTYEQTVPDVEKFPQSRFPLLASMMAGLCYALCGQITQGLGMLDAIRTHCQKKGDRYAALYAKHTIGGIMLIIGRLDEAIRILEECHAAAIREHINWIMIITKFQLSSAYYQKKEDKRAIAYLQDFFLQSKQVHVQLPPGNDLLEFGWAMQQRQLPKLPSIELENVIRKSIRGEDICSKGVAYRYQALLKKQRGFSPEKIVKSLNLSMRWLEESGFRIEQARTQLELARQYLSFKNKGKAREMATSAYKILASINEELFPDDLRHLIKDSPQRQNLLNEILQMGQEAVTIRDNRELVQHVISNVNRITGAERGAIFLWNAGTYSPKLELRASKGLTTDEVDADTFHSSRQMINEVAGTGKGCIKGKSKGGNGGSRLGNAIQSRICVPMIIRDKVVGVLYHDNRLLSSAFKESDLQLLAYFAAFAAIALDNSEEYAKMRRQSQKLWQEKLYYEQEQLNGHHFKEIVGESAVIKGVLSQVNQVAGTETTVLILGQTGVGKELVARAIHRHSPRSEMPLIRVHCSALPESLVPSELFGHEKGAFTGATHRRIGRFELANKGTLFLDEIGDLSPEVQVRLLRVLQTKEFERVGGTETISSDFRLVAATNRNLEDEVKAGNFRADLFYRLNVFPIYVPPLRERLDDIPLLAHYFLSSYSKKMGKTFERIDAGEMRKLFGYEWPGNVRELENVIERGTILNSGPAFQVPELTANHPESASPKGVATLKEVEQRHIIWVLQKTGWKVRGPAGAAELLKMPPSTLETKIKKLGIKRPKNYRRKKNSRSNRR